MACPHLQLSSSLCCDHYPWTHVVWFGFQWYGLLVHQWARFYPSGRIQGKHPIPYHWWQSVVLREIVYVIPGSGRSSGVGKDLPLQHSCLGNSMDGGAWQATVYGMQRIRHDWATEHARTYMWLSELSVTSLSLQSCLWSFARLPQNIFQKQLISEWWYLDSIIRVLDIVFNCWIRHSLKNLGCIQNKLPATSLIMGNRLIAPTRIIENALHISADIRDT